MRTKDKYTYTLNAVWTADGVEMSESNSVHPVLTKMEVKYERPSSEMYYEKTFNSEFSLVGSEYSLIAAKKVSTKFTFIVKSGNVEVARCTFRKSDCEIDINHKEVKVKPKADNPYELLNGKLDDEIDIKPLHPSMKTLSYKVRPVLQCYIPGSSYITTTTICGSSQSSITPVSDGVTLVNNGFRLSDYYFFARINIESGGNILGSSYDSRFSTHDSSLTNYDFTYQGLVKFSMYAYLNQQTDVLYVRYKIVVGGNSVYDEVSETKWDDRFRLSNDSIRVTFEYNGEPCFINVNSITCKYLYSRVLTAYSTNSIDRVVVGTDDAFNSGVYKFAYRYRITGDYMKASVATSLSPTEYGKYNESEYYAHPPSSVDIEPIGQDVWNGEPSLWVMDKNRITSIFNSGTYQSRTMTLKDWYSFGSVLNVVLKKLDSRIVFDETTEYSQFLFSNANPVVGNGTIQLTQGRLYMLQKSNLLTLDYDVASNSNKITLRKMLQFLKYALNCYWHFQEYIEDGEKKYKFHVEHVSYYLNGGSYGSTDARSVVDLNALVDSMNGRKLSYNTNNWSYDVGTGNGTATKIQYHWMDKQSRLFDGYDVDVPDEYRILTDNTTEERTIDWFNSDIDYLMANKSECSNDGFLIVWTASNNDNAVPIDNSSTSITYNQQNYRLAISWLMQHILLYNIGSKYVKINNKSFNTEVKGVKSMRKATVKFIPKSGADVTPDYKIKTEVGDGVVNTITTDLTSGLVTAELLYELED